MKMLIVTPVYRLIGPAIFSWAQAFNHFKEIRPYDKFDHLWQYGDNQTETDFDMHDVVIRKYVNAQKIFLAGDWDCMVCLEDDIVLPKDGLARLISTIDSGVDVAYGLYCWRRGAAKWSAYYSLDGQAGKSFSSDPSMAAKYWDQEAPVAGVGLGFTAIRRKVLEAIPFTRRGPASNDWYFALDAQKIGYTQVCNLAVRCGHFSFTPSPRIIYPDINAENFVRIDLQEQLV